MGDWFDGSGHGGAIDVQEVCDAGAVDLVLGIAAAGALVSIGTTSDGGALGITVTLDGRYRREYFRDADELREWLTGAFEAVRGAAESRPAPAGRRRRSKAL